MQTATVELKESEWVRIILALEFKAQNDSVNSDAHYLQQFETLADEIRELVKAQILA
jgi:hypothetical protein